MTGRGRGLTLLEATRGFAKAKPRTLGPRGAVKAIMGRVPRFPGVPRRWDFPEVHPYSRGSLPELGTPELRGAHLRSLQEAMFARSTRPSRDSLW